MAERLSISAELDEDEEDDSKDGKKKKSSAIGASIIVKASKTESSAGADKRQLTGFDKILKDLFPADSKEKEAENKKAAEAFRKAGEKKLDTKLPASEEVADAAAAAAVVEAEDILRRNAESVGDVIELRGLKDNEIYGGEVVVDLHDEFAESAKEGGIDIVEDVATLEGSTNPNEPETATPNAEPSPEPEQVGAASSETDADRDVNANQTAQQKATPQASSSGSGTGAGSGGGRSGRSGAGSGGSVGGGSGGGRPPAGNTPPFGNVPPNFNNPPNANNAPNYNAPQNPNNPPTPPTGPGQNYNNYNTVPLPPNPNSLSQILANMFAIELAAARGRRQGHGEGLLAGVAIGSAIGHIRHKRRERQMIKKAKAEHKKQAKRLEAVEFQQNRLRTDQLELARKAEADMYARRQAAKNEMAATAKAQMAESRARSSETQARLSEAEALKRTQEMKRAAEQKEREKAELIDRLNAQARKQEEAAEAVKVADDHHIETSAWHAYEVDNKTGKAVEQSSIEYGHEYYREKAHESGPKENIDSRTGAAALAAAAMSQSGTAKQQGSQLNLPPMLGMPSRGSSAISETSKTDQIGPIMPDDQQKTASVASLVPWVVILITIVIVIFVLM